METPMSHTTLGAAPAPRGRAERMLVVARMAGVVGVLWDVRTTHQKLRSELRDAAAG